ncbi:hypothetical protein [Croceicoccus gelatinilyticus]|uniref:hypothetical protein n=1 Tax=Croceicoccus gelatinilyticus TaxID=2835536 RepID=UPI001BCEB78E|nr:hypothetical protein [Croceicoccus gelatinilyticus]MBS7671170.1 hypothetical protein [Croceicoccus gelatinilyticus]
MKAAKTFRFQFGSGGEESGSSEFEALDFAIGIDRLSRETASEHASVWYGSAFLGNLVKDEQGVWRLQKR